MEDIRIHSIISTLEAPSVGWSALSNYWAACAIGFGPKYYDYLALPDVLDQEKFFSKENDAINAPLGLGKSITPIGRMEDNISAWAVCFTENMRTFENAPYDKANSPLESANYFKNQDRKSNISMRHPLAEVNADVVTAMRIQDSLKNQQRYNDTVDHTDKVVGLMMGRTWMTEAQLQGIFTNVDPITPEMIAERGRKIYVHDLFENIEDTFNVDDLDDLLASRNEDKPYDLFARFYQQYFSTSVTTGWAASFHPELLSFAYMLVVSFNQLKVIHDELQLNLPEPLKIFQAKAKAKGYKTPKSPD